MIPGEPLRGGVKERTCQSLPVNLERKRDRTKLLGATINLRERNNCFTRRKRFSGKNRGVRVNEERSERKSSEIASAEMDKRGLGRG